VEINPLFGVNDFAEP